MLRSVVRKEYGRCYKRLKIPVNSFEGLPSTVDRDFFFSYLLLV
jgi:hypothetical protein